MYTLYTFATPNSIKPVIALEELGVPYAIQGVNVRKGEQKNSAFVAINPNAKLPVLTVSGQDGAAAMTLTESGAILVYLAEQHGALLPAAGEARARAFEQLFFHASGIGPAFGQSGYFQKSAPEVLPSVIARFHGEAQRTLAILDAVLAKNTYVAGEEYSIADIAHFGWMWRRAFANIDFSASPNVARWYDLVLQRPAVQRAIAKVDALIPAA